MLASAGFEEGSRGQAAVGAGRRPVRGEEAHRGVPRAARRGPRGRRAGPRRRRACRARRRRPRRRPARAWTSTSARVAKREPGMNPVEVLTSESQERMLAIVDARQPRRGARARASGGRSARRSSAASPTPVASASSTGYFDAIGVPGANPRAAARRRAARGLLGPRAGRRRPDRQPRRRPALPPPARAAGRPRRAPGRRPGAGAAARGSRPAPISPTELLALLASPNIADKSWVWRQYDHQLFLNTVAGPGGDASVLRLKETDGTALALSVDGKGRFCRARPARRRAARGARGGAQRRVQRRARRWRSSTASTSATRSTPR